MSREVHVRFCESREVRSLPATHPIVVALALRSVTRRAGSEALDKHWPGSTESLQAVQHLAGIHDANT